MTTHFFEHWSKVPPGLWRWPNFSPEEIACRRTGKIKVNERALDMLQGLRDDLGCPLMVTSAYRSPEHNATLKGAAKYSKHLDGIAFDISMANHDPAPFIAAAVRRGFKGIGSYPRSGFIHIDARSYGTRWGDPFPARPVRFVAEPPRVRESLAESRTMAGAGMAGAGTAGGAAVEEISAAVSEAQIELAGFAAYLPALKWVMIALAVAGIALTIYARLDDWREARR